MDENYMPLIWPHPLNNLACGTSQILRDQEYRNASDACKGPFEVGRDIN